MMAHFLQVYLARRPATEWLIIYRQAASAVDYARLGGPQLRRINGPGYVN